MELSAIQFEHLLLEFCKQDFPPGFEIEHDYKETGIESENKRQIDVRIKGHLGISRILVCGEAKNWNESVGSEVIDGVVGKYLSGEIKANKVILFSSMGFTEPAITRAKKLGIELLRPYTLGSPIIKVPYIVSVGYLDQMIVQIVYDGTQQTFIAVDMDDYVISERISFQQMVCRSVVSALRSLPRPDIHIEIAKLTVDESNILYELKSIPGQRHNGHFKVEVRLKWDFFAEDVNDAVLFHVNSENTLHVKLENDQFAVIKQVLMSNDKRNYESRATCITTEVQNSVANAFVMVIVDPDQNKNDPHNPIFNVI